MNEFALLLGLLALWIVVYAAGAAVEWYTQRAWRRQLAKLERAMDAYSQALGAAIADVLREAVEHDDDTG